MTRTLCAPGAPEYWLDTYSTVQGRRSTLVAGGLWTFTRPPGVRVKNNSGRAPAARRPRAGPSAAAAAFQTRFNHSVAHYFGRRPWAARRGEDRWGQAAVRRRPPRRVTARPLFLMRMRCPPLSNPSIYYFPARRAQHAASPG